MTSLNVIQIKAHHNDKYCVSCGTFCLTHLPKKLLLLFCLLTVTSNRAITGEYD